MRSYDHRDQLLTTVEPTGAATPVKRRADGKVIAETTPRGVAAGTTETDGSCRYFTSHYTYDPAGDLLMRTVPYAPTTTTAFNGYSGDIAWSSMGGIGQVAGQLVAEQPVFLGVDLAGLGRRRWPTCSVRCSACAPRPGCCARA
ncbi:MAG TPA: hypothetical protein VNT03_09065 [Baekduia sp.]|nr:hypothetical protein [Baekduia sp.]